MIAGKLVITLSSTSHSSSSSRCERGGPGGHWGAGAALQRQGRVSTGHRCSDTRPWWPMCGAGAGPAWSHQGSSGREHLHGTWMATCCPAYSCTPKGTGWGGAGLRREVQGHGGWKRRRRWCLRRFTGVREINIKDIMNKYRFFKQMTCQRRGRWEKSRSGNGFHRRQRRRQEKLAILSSKKFTGSEIRNIGDRSTGLKVAAR
jgi:hypothetical protein